MSKSGGWVTMVQLKRWVMDAAGIESWLLDDCKRFTGSMNEAMALVLGSSGGDDVELEGAEVKQLLAEMENLLASPDWEKQTWVVTQWHRMTVTQRMQFNALLTGRYEGLILKSHRGILPVKAGSVLEFVEVTAVLLYAKAGRMGAYGELSMALSDGGGGLVVVAKVDLGIAEGNYGWLQTWISENAGERFGPIVSLPAAVFFRIRCEAVALSKRHKSGLQVGKALLVSRLENGNLMELTEVGAVSALLG
jgi:hypothetical protein